MTRQYVWSTDDILALGVLTDIVTAGSILGLGRTTAHKMAREETFPVPVIKVGHRYRVPVAGLLKVIDSNQ